MIGDLVAIVAPVLITVAIGYGWARTGRTFDTEFVTGIVLSVATPCLIFSSLTRLEVSFDALASIAAAYATILLVTGIGGAVLLFAVLRLPASPYLPTIMFGNLGNMGIPLSLFAFGQEGLALAVAAFAVHSVAQFTIGVSIHAGGLSARQVVRTPVVYGVLLSLLFMALGIRLPLWAANTVDLLASLVVPLMLLTLGVSLARMQIKGLGRSVVFALLRLLGGLGAGLLAVEIFDLEGVVRGVVILQSAMPVAIFNYVFALRYQRMPEEVAAAIVVSTLVSFATLPALLILVL